MDKYAKLFIIAAMGYLALGTLLGLCIAIQPEWNARLRFVHIHINLLGFMTMFIAGVAYHVIPRFNSQPVPWPEGVRHHFIMQNVGLLGMVGAHLAGGFIQGGFIHVLFAGFSILTGISLLIMVYNLWGSSKDTDMPKKITGDMKVGYVLDKFPAAMPVFLASGFSALANPVALKTFAKLISIEKACDKHNVSASEFLSTLNAELFGQSKPPESGPGASPPKPIAQEGRPIKNGELCAADTLVGSLLQVYPETRAVFEKHYGEGCFSCPGQSFESVQQTAQMHNVDLKIILAEINRVVDSHSQK